jgi:hypothetical protein
MTLTCLSQVCISRNLLSILWLMTTLALASVPKPLPSKHVTLQDKQARAFDWNAGPTITPLSLNDVSNDLLAMGVCRSGILDRVYNS